MKSECSQNSSHSAVSNGCLPSISDNVYKPGEGNTAFPDVGCMQGISPGSEGVKKTRSAVWFVLGSWQGRWKIKPVLNRKKKQTGEPRCTTAEKLGDWVKMPQVLRSPSQL